MLSAALSLMVLAAIALAGGAVWLWRRGAARKQVALMLVLAAVLAVNVAIWAVPDERGQSLAGTAK